MATWGFITNHGLVLAAIARHPRSTAREIGDAVGITERATHNIIKGLEEAGYITKTRDGRKNHYRLHPGMPLDETAVSDAAIGELLVMLGWKRRKSPDKAAAAEEAKE
ncbi:MAG TPA: helix-turn-helix domain-containing protein [Dehalococcoidia bacterium]|nr:helix-turn-helix domain-containing protein [Dehalococcoidia bacterium]